MTDRNDPDVTSKPAKEADAVAPETDTGSGAESSNADDTGTTDTGAAPRGKSARRPGSAVGVSKPAADDDSGESRTALSDKGPDEGSDKGKVKGPDPDRREFSFTVTGNGIKKLLAAVLAIALVALVGFLGWRAYDLQREADAFADSKTASADFVTKLVTTLNAANAGNSKELLGPLSTGELRDRLEQERADTEANVESLNIEVSSTISVVAVEAMTADTAKTVVMAEVTGRSSKLPNGGTSLMVFRLDLSKEDGKWLVSKVDGPPGSPSGQIDPSQSLPGGGAPAPQQPQAPQQAPQPAPAPAG
jgi:Mce-associated membrane protein